MRRALLVLLLLVHCVHAHAQPGASGTPPSPLINATANVVLYVNGSSGSNSNACLSSGAAACATIQHALNIAAQHDYRRTYTATINVADGTYAVNGSGPAAILPSLFNYPPNAYPTLTGDTATPANAVISNTSGDALATDWHVFWTVKGFRLKSTSGTNNDLNVQNYSQVQIDNIDFAGSGTLLNAENFSTVNYIGSAITSSTTSAVIGLSAFFFGNIINDSGTWTFNNSPTFSSYVLFAADYSIIGAGTYLNGGTVTGPRLKLDGYSFLEATVSRASLPGNGITHIEQNSFFVGDANSVLGAYTNSSATLADTIGLSDNAGNLWGDYNISNSGRWTLQRGLTINGSQNSFTGFATVNNSSGGHTISMNAIGSAGAFGQAVGAGDLIDVTTGNLPFWWDANANLGVWAVLQWGASSSGSSTVPTVDTGLSRTAGGILALGNGTAGDATGTLNAKFIRSPNAAGGVGYATGAGGTVSQSTNKTIGVTLSKASGQITMNNATLAAGTIVSFMLTNTSIAATDVLVLNHISGGTLGAYTLNAACAAGSAVIYVRNNTARSLSEAIVIQFALIKGVNSFLLERDLSPANDNSPAWLNQTA